MRGLIRLHVDHDLGPGQQVVLSRDQAHYLFGVMRLTAGAGLLLFNGRDGEWAAEVAVAGKRAGELVCHAKTRPQVMPPDLWLLFAPVKKAQTDFIVEKAVELGARRLVPVVTDFTNAERVRRDRLQAHALEAAEQCGATFVPEVTEAQKLPAVLTDLGNRQLMFCDETRVGAPAQFSGQRGDPWAVLIGPEGGFSDAERARVAGMENTVPVALGPRILRAETAAVAALTLWQAHLGDWQWNG